ncbi:hypothetical protein [Candidatus Chloroploca sp. Khr17]|uniref:hypothetical protein n=1 Tax=Candidatus Chloroploca sp. Khr17 TaxID=2496869 RepID=UPI00101C3718|nr:hypothetical protein [Candidatus Chloroploca sp. Khr17]
MNHVISIVLWLYVRLALLYPRELREAFGDEFLAVFDLKLREAGSRGMLAVTAVVWAEFRNLPGIVVQTGWSTERIRPTWQQRAAIWAAMAPFLLSALLQAGKGLTVVGTHSSATG